MDGTQVPPALLASGLYSVKLQPLRNIPQAGPFQELPVDPANHLRLLFIDDKVSVLVLGIPEKMVVVDLDLPFLIAELEPELYVLGKALGFLLGQRGHDCKKQLTACLQSMYVLLLEIYVDVLVPELPYIFQAVQGISYEEVPVYNGVGNPGDYVFSGWSVLPENITSDLDCYAEYQFVGLYFRQLMNSTLLAYEDVDGIETIGSYAFAGERSLMSVSMPMLTAVPASCFRGCSALMDVNLPKVLATNEYSLNTVENCAALSTLIKTLS